MPSPSVSSRDILARIRTFNAALDDLMRLYTDESVTAEVFLQVVTERACALLGAQRFSTWTLLPGSSGIECLDLFLADRDEHTSGQTLYAADFPGFFKAVLGQRVIAASDAATDLRTREFKEVYLTPNRVVSMLGAQIRSASGPRGVICVETVDQRRDWSPDETAFATSVAELLGMSMEMDSQRRVQAMLADTNTQLAAAVDAVHEANERYDLAIAAAYDGIWDWDVLTDEMFYSDQNFKLLGESFEVPPNRADWWQSRVHPQDLPRLLDDFRALLKHDTPYNATYRIRHSSGTWCWWRSRGKVVRDKSFKALRVVGTNSDVTALMEARDELEQRNQQLLDAHQKVEHRALHDVLTGLPNRRYLEQHAAEIFKTARSADHVVSVVHIDLDHFKEVNDQLGHAAGDQVLQHAASVLRQCGDCGGIVARIGGDEFVAFLYDAADGSAATRFAQQVIDILSRPLVIGGETAAFGASIGIAQDLDRCEDIWHLLGNADLALYEAKNAGKNRYEIYSAQMRVQAAFVRKTKGEIQTALDEGTQFVPFFQAQFHAGNLELAGAEALARWYHPERGVLAPDAFLDLAEDMQQVSEIDQQILSKSLSTAVAWRAQGFELPHLSVNVSSDRLADPTLLSCIKKSWSGFPELSFELLESTYLDDTSEQVADTLRQLRDLGVDLEIDDFGTGYASIVSLLNIRPKRLKIDRSLVATVDTDSSMAQLVQAIVDIARSLNMEVIAEGVETNAHAKVLTAIGCDYLQGHGLAKPMSMKMFYDYFSSQSNVRDRLDPDLTRDVEDWNHPRRVEHPARRG